MSKRAGLSQAINRASMSGPTHGNGARQLFQMSVTNVVVDHIIQLIAAARNRPSIPSAENPLLVE